MAKLIETQGILGYEFPGVHFDVGTPLGLLKASVYEALQRDGVSGEFRAWVDGGSEGNREMEGATPHPP